MQIHRFETEEQMGAAAATHVATRIRALAAQHLVVPVAFATGASQLQTLAALTARHPGLPWDRVIGFHLDEYVGISDQHPASFRHYLREQLVRKVPFRAFYFIEGDAPDPAAVADAYAALLRANPPLLALAGIGENGHLAFNDPPVADFADPHTVKVVELDRPCRQQQVNEGWFPTLQAVPSHAITLTIPTLMAIPELILSVPGPRKAAIAHLTLTDPISPRCPATILRTHPNAHLYLDRASSALHFAQS